MSKHWEFPAPPDSDDWDRSLLWLKDEHTRIETGHAAERHEQATQRLRGLELDLEARRCELVEREKQLIRDGFLLLAGYGVLFILSISERVEKLVAAPCMLAASMLLVFGWAVQAHRLKAKVNE